MSLRQHQDLGKRTENRALSPGGCERMTYKKISQDLQEQPSPQPGSFLSWPSSLLSTKCHSQGSHSPWDWDPSGCFKNLRATEALGLGFSVSLHSFPVTERGKSLSGKAWSLCSLSYHLHFNQWLKQDINPGCLTWVWIWKWRNDKLILWLFYHQLKQIKSFIWDTPGVLQIGFHCHIFLGAERVDKSIWVTSRCLPWH